MQTRIETPAAETPAVPEAYRAGYEKARAISPARAERYVGHTVIGDPAADAAVEALATVGGKRSQRFIQAGMDQDAQGLAMAPQPVRDLFERLDTPPAWLDPAAFQAGRRTFHRNSNLYTLAYVADVDIRGLTTLIGLVFFTTGRTIDQGVQRLRRNVLHLLEIMMPGSLERHGDGWKLSVRIRLVHARVRQLMIESGDWDTDELGTPISSAHVALASASFSAELLDSAERLGARASDEERAGFVQIWRYAAWLLGVPDTILFRDEADARELCRIGYLCEPPFGDESIIMAHALINAVPRVGGIHDRDERRRLAALGFRVSRALIGDELADALRYPPQRTFGLLALLRWKLRLEAALADRIGVRLGRGDSQFARFQAILDTSALDDGGFSYRLPEDFDAHRDPEW